MTTTNKFFTDNMGGTAATSYIGVVGEVFYDTSGDTPLRLSDGHTPGGIAFGVSSAINTFNPDFKAAGGALTGAVATGTYVKQGPVVHFGVNVDFTNCTDFQASSNTQYQFTLPFPVPNTTSISIRGGTLHQNTGNTFYHIAGITDPSLNANNTLMKLYYFGSTQDLPLRAAVPVGALTNTATLDISGSYITSSTLVA
jgi:hypothetical protein